MRVRIEIDTRTFVRFWLVVFGFVLAFGLVYFSRDALLLIGLSFFLALALNPPVNYIAKKLPGKSRVGATAIAYVFVMLLLGGFIFTVVPPVVEQSARFAERVPGFIEIAGNQAFIIDDFVDRYGLQDQYQEAIQNAQNQAASFASGLSSSFVSGAGAVLNGAISTLIVIVMTFLMLVEGPAWMKRIWGLYKDPARLKRHHEVVSQMYKVVSGYVNGQLLVAGTAGIVSAITVLLLSAFFNLPINLAMPIAVVVFVGGLIPMFGSTIGGIVAVILLAFNDIGAALIFGAFFIVYQQIENNFISPVIQSKTVELSALSVLVAVTIGIYLFGILGGLISIPIAGCIRVLINYYLARTRREREKKDNKPLRKFAKKVTASKV